MNTQSMNTQSMDIANRWLSKRTGFITATFAALALQACATWHYPQDRNQHQYWDWVWVQWETNALSRGIVTESSRIPSGEAAEEGIAINKIYQEIQQAANLKELKRIKSEQKNQILSEASDVYIKCYQRETTEADKAEFLASMRCKSNIYSQDDVAQWNGVFSCRLTATETRELALQSIQNTCTLEQGQYKIESWVGVGESAQQSQGQPQIWELLFKGLNEIVKTVKWQ